MWQARPVLYEVISKGPPFLPFRYSTSLLGEPGPGSPSIVVLCGCACVWTMSKICEKRGVLEIKFV